MNRKNIIEKIKKMQLDFINVNCHTASYTFAIFKHQIFSVEEQRFRDYTEFTIYLNMKEIIKLNDEEFEYIKPSKLSFDEIEV